MQHDPRSRRQLALDELVREAEKLQTRTNEFIGRATMVDVELPGAVYETNAELLRLPDRLRELATRAHRSGSAVPSRRPRSREGGADRALATAIRVARQQADLSQGELAERLGIRQSSVSQWERGTTEPTGRRLIGLMGELPGLAEALKNISARHMRGWLETDSSSDTSSGQP